MPTAGIVLAAGKGTRMRSDIPKCLHSVCDVPMARLVADAMIEAGISRPIIVIGHGGDALRKALGDRFDYVVQSEQLGTGHATLAAREVLASHSGPVVVASGDTPLIDADLLKRLIGRHIEAGAACTLTTAMAVDAGTYGRIIRSGGNAVAVVEARDADRDSLAIQEFNAGLYCFDAKALFEVLPTLGHGNAQGEYYLTDAVAALSTGGRTIETLNVENPDQLVGVNDRWQLSQAERSLRMRLVRILAESGVTVRDPDSTYIGAEVVVGPDTILEPGVAITGATTIGAGCKIGPFTKIDDCKIGNGATVVMSHLVRAEVHDGAKVGPFANLRPGAKIGNGAKVGNFVEVKNAVVGDGASAAHLAYLGDAEIGAGANVGAGVITCNFDGFDKHRTSIGEGAFIGSNSTLVAPVSIGSNAIIAAGSVVTHDVSSDAMAIARVRQEVKEEWAAHWRKRKQSATE